MNTFAGYRRDIRTALRKGFVKAVAVVGPRGTPPPKRRNMDASPLDGMDEDAPATASGAQQAPQEPRALFREGAGTPVTMEAIAALLDLKLAAVKTEVTHAREDLAEFQTAVRTEVRTINNRIG